LPSPQLSCGVTIWNIGAFLDTRELTEVELDFHYQLAKFQESMLVCHCHALTDRDIRRAVRASGACNVAEVGDHCGAATGCGGCYEVVAEIVQNEKRRLAVLPAEHGVASTLPEPSLALTG
jgi:bacterioferritin-associated ferredoxin